MPLCELCRGLTIAKLFPPNIYHHANSLSALEISGQSCSICQMMHWCIQHFGGTNEVVLDLDGASKAPHYDLRDWPEATLKLQVILGTKADTGLTNSETPDTLGKRVDHKEVKCIDQIGIWLHSRIARCRIRLAVEEGDELGSSGGLVNGNDYFIYGQVPPSDVPTDGYFALAKDRLQDCVANHHACNESSSDLPVLPHRIINIAEGHHDPYLMLGEGKRARYATLSHCWGGALTAKTTKDTLSEHERGIPLQELPRTYREAIETCKKLKIPYLWIDSLCIIQDDIRDWERESEMMGTIYFESTLTLSATAASNSTEGLFNPEKHSDQVPDPWELIIQLPLSFSDSQSRVYVTAPPFNVYYHPRYFVEGSVLQTRGWVMQERYLSRRTLHFTSRGMMWECCTEKRGQYGYHELELVDKDSKLFLVQMRRCKNALSVMRMLADEDRSEGIEEEAGDTKMTEGNIKEEGGADFHNEHLRPEQEATISATPRYADSPLMDGIDRVQLPLFVTHPTIATTLASDPHIETFIAQALTRTFYFFWYDKVSIYSKRSLTFPADKLPAMAGLASRVRSITNDEYFAGHWRYQLERSLFWNASDKACRPKTYRAPSWSWASMEGELWWDFRDTREEYHEAPIRIIDTRTAVQGQNAFGRVTDGCLCIRASVIRAIWDATELRWTFTGKSSSHPEGKSVRWNRGSMWPLLPIYATEEHCEQTGIAVGWWQYDEITNGILPGPVITSSTPEDEIKARMLSEIGGIPINDTRSESGSPAPPIWERGTYAPEELVLVKGPERREKLQGSLHDNINLNVEILVLARNGEHAVDYRRVGRGELMCWDKEVETVEILKVV